MAEPVAVVIAVAGVDDDVARDAVDRTAVGALAVGECVRQRVDRRLLGTRHELVDLEILGPRLTDEQRPRHVRAVAGDLRAEVEQQHLAGRDAARDRASHAEAPRAGPDRHATSKASASAPLVRISHSRLERELVPRSCRP